MVTNPASSEPTGLYFRALKAFIGDFRVARGICRFTPQRFCETLITDGSIPTHPTYSFLATPRKKRALASALNLKTGGPVSRINALPTKNASALRTEER